MGGDNKRKNDGGSQKGGKKAKTDIHKVGKYLPGGFPIDPKMKGVMVTCVRGREVQASREACDLLSEYAEKLYGAHFNDEVAADDEEESIEDAIKREVAQAKKPKGGKKFLPLMTGTDCVIFIRAMDIEPSKLCHFILTDMIESGNKRTRYCQRFIPVDETSYANMDDIETMSKRVLAPYFHAEDQKPTTFKVLPKIRHNDKVERDALMKMLASQVGTSEKHVVKMVEPEYMILAEVIKSICFLSVVKDYDLLKKYNIQSIFEASLKNSDEASEKQE
ncbi:tRNA acetyltransferase TAN1 [Entomortierella parvispora]|uniref:tRNA acetyltransferase TAN1 n=1 Tax=Entomortierella parvispora TaxID=205924 RepID=A0A9P3HL59_9FUNG|nr:tRNA acetyltransferase TAN1 [Entomortierella parvispora]